MSMIGVTQPIQRIFLTLCILTSTAAATTVSLKPVGQLGDPRFRHPGTVRWLRVLPGGKQLVTHSAKPSSEGDQPVLTLWDLATGKQIREITIQSHHQNFVLATQLSTDGKRVLVASNSHLHLWEIHSGTLHKIKLDKQTEFHAAAISADGKRLFAITSTGLTLWDIPSKKIIRKCTTHRGSRFDSVTLSADGKFAWAEHEKFILEFDATSGKRLRVFQPLSVQKATDTKPRQTSAYGERIGDLTALSGSNLIFRGDCHFRGVDTKTREINWRVDSHYGVLSASADGVLFALRTSSFYGIPQTEFFLTASHKRIFTLARTGINAFAVRRHQGKNELISAVENRIARYGLATGKQSFPAPAAFLGATDQTRITTLNGGKRILFSDPTRYGIHIWNRTTPATHSRWLAGKKVTFLHANPKKSLLLVICSQRARSVLNNPIKGECYILDTTSGKILAQQPLGPTAISARFSADGTAVQIDTEPFTYKVRMPEGYFTRPTYNHILWNWTKAPDALDAVTFTKTKSSHNPLAAIIPDEKERRSTRLLQSSYSPNRLWAYRGHDHRELRLYTRPNQTPKPLTEAQCKTLLRQLDSSEYVTRQNAFKALMAIPYSDLKTLLELANADPVVQNSAEAKARVKEIGARVPIRKTDYRLSGELTLNHFIYSFAEHPNGRQWAAFGEKTLSLGRINKTGLTVTASLPIKKPFTKIQFLPSGELLIVTSEGLVDLYRLTPKAPAAEK
jgi:hypothetical protein